MPFWISRKVILYLIFILKSWAANGCNSIMAIDTALSSLSVVDEGGDEDETEAASDE